MCSRKNAERGCLVIHSRKLCDVAKMMPITRFFATQKWVVDIATSERCSILPHCQLKTILCISSWPSVFWLADHFGTSEIFEQKEDQICFLRPKLSGTPIQTCLWNFVDIMAATGSPRKIPGVEGEIFDMALLVLCFRGWKFWQLSSFPVLFAFPTQTERQLRLGWNFKKKWVSRQEQQGKVSSFWQREGYHRKSSCVKKSRANV